MKRANFPYVGFLLGVSLLVTVMGGRELDLNGEPLLPLLMLLLMNEFAFIVGVISVFIGIKQMSLNGIRPLLLVVTGLCALISLVALFLGVQMWPL